MGLHVIGSSLPPSSDCVLSLSLSPRPHPYPYPPLPVSLPPPHPTHPWPFPHKGDLGPLAVEQGAIGGREVSVLKQGAGLQTALPQLLEALT